MSEELVKFFRDHYPEDVATIEAAERKRLAPDLRGYPVLLFHVAKDDSWAAEVPDLPGCVGAADTLAETLALVADAIDGWLDAARKIGRRIPIATDPWTGARVVLARWHKP